MAEPVSLTPLFERRRLWHGRAQPGPLDGVPTGLAMLDAALPQGGWPAAALSEILLALDGLGELRLLLPSLARLSAQGRPVVLVAPPYQPCVAGWRAAGLDMRHIEIVEASGHDALWAMEQCLRSASCAAVLGWPGQADDRALRRLQVAADGGQTLAFIFRDRRHAAQASPAALRLELENQPTPQLWVRKCRGGHPPAWPIALPAAGHG